MDKYTIIFNIKSDWHIGNGKQGGAYAEALAIKNKHHLPYIPGKSVKGLLRDAFQTASENGWLGDDSNKIMNELFGNEGLLGDAKQGVIQVSSACLSPQETRYLTSGVDTKHLEKHLYRVIQSTAINKESGVAKHTSLRSLEVVVPMVLTAEVSLNTSHPDYLGSKELSSNFGKWLVEVVTLIQEFGGKRHRGLGQVTVSVKGE